MLARLCEGGYNFAMLSPVAPLRLTAPTQWFTPLWLVAAVCISIIFHIGVLFVQFVMPEHASTTKATIEMMLVNDYNQLRNDEAKVFANAALQGGGDADNGRKTSPLMREEDDKNGNALQAQEAKVAAMETTMKQQLLAAKKTTMKEFDVAGMEKKEQREWVEAFAVIARRQAEIEKNIQDYNARPRKYFDGPNTNSHDAAVYVQQWRNRVEDWGNQHYPEDARGQIYGDVVLTVEIDQAGRMLSINVEKGSGHDVLDKAAINSVKRSSPFGKFTGAMKSSMDILVLTRTWSYSTTGLATKGS